MSEFRDRLAEALRDEYGVPGGLGLGWRGYADRLIASGGVADPAEVEALRAKVAACRAALSSSGEAGGL